MHESPEPNTTDLGRLIEERQAAGGLPPAEATKLMRRLAETVGRAHQLQPPLIHRNLQPANILVASGERQLPGDESPGDNEPQFTIADSGVAASPLYTSPEQLQQAPPDPRNDVYALGVIWYQMLSGNLAGGRPGGSHWRKRLADQGMAAALIDLLEACFEDDPQYRPADAAALASQLAGFLASPQPPTPPSPPRGGGEGGGSPVAETEPRPLRAEPKARPRRAGVMHLLDRLQQEQPEQQKLFTNSIGMKLVLIPAGTFNMGSPPEEKDRRDHEHPPHEVNLTKAFYMAVHAVTQEQYERVVGANPSRFHAGNGGGPDHPVESVSWQDAAEFCRRLSELPAEVETGRKYRLPMEAEWEYACRAGTTTPFCYGTSLSSSQANIDGNYPYGDAAKGPWLQKTSPVGSYPANNFGLYDLHGNVWEWCADWYDGTYYQHSPKKDPLGPTTGQYRGLRGGSWRNHAATCRAAYRNGLLPNHRDIYTGFRVVVSAA